MIRINCIPVQHLTRQHLIAEYRELPRVLTLAIKAYERGDLKTPNLYTLGTGHVRFFYTRLGYLADRYARLVQEMYDRGYTPNRAVYMAVLDGFYNAPAELMGEWTPNERAININKQRIEERLAA